MNCMNALIFIILLFLFPTWAHLHTAYSHNCETNYRNVDWMSGVNDSIPIRKISILGTHDTMAYQMKLDGLFENSIITETVNLETQLLIGIRAFDILMIVLAYIMEIST